MVKSNYSSTTRVLAATLFVNEPWSLCVASYQSLSERRLSWLEWIAAFASARLYLSSFDQESRTFCGLESLSCGREHSGGRRKPGEFTIHRFCFPTRLLGTWLSGCFHFHFFIGDVFVTPTSGCFYKLELDMGSFLLTNPIQSKL